ncbi:MAG TPA: purine-nucleoside phosphorylase, partial [Bdellovibrionales bacterium]|nr:purine-nucleoside phosphorylase [Bdellovibrionales bacterium]
MNTLFKNLMESKEFLEKKITTPPKLGFVLGSGLASFGNSIELEHSFSFSDIPHFSSATIEGHPGKLLFGKLHGVSVAVLQGRLHAYEGLEFQKVVHPLRTLKMLGVEDVVVTNAAGGLKATMKPGEFMVITDHINFTGNNPLIGENLSELGPRFVDMTEPYNKDLTKLLLQSLKAHKIRHSKGVYCVVLGPTYETASEIQMFKKLGGGAVGMSTVAEVIAANHAGLRVAGMSCITNLGTGLSKVKLTHEDVKEVAKKVEKNFSIALKDFTKR